MLIRSLGNLAKILMPVLCLLLTGCGTSANQTNTCSGCSFLYATTNSNQVLTFKLESSGALGAETSTPGPVNGPDIAAAAGGPVYASDFSSNAINAFAVDGNGSLNSLPGSPFNVGGSPGNPDGLLVFGNYLYAGETNGTIAAYNIGANGVLTTAIAGSPFAAGFAPVNLVSTYTNPPNAPSIPLLYAADFSGGGIWAFTIGTDGGLTAVAGSPFATPSNSQPAGMAAAGNATSTLYVALSGLNEIAAFSISATGALTPLPSSPFAAGRGPNSLLAQDSFLYGLNSLDHTISAYSVDQNSGNLTEIVGSPYSAGTAERGLTNNYGNVLYAPDLNSNSILAFSVDETAGTLSPLTGSPFAMSVGPVALTTIRFPVLDPP
jgi:6-phosphogluconolactonase